jgi:hypothetical protein
MPMEIAGTKNGKQKFEQKEAKEAKVRVRKTPRCGSGESVRTVE